MNIKILKGGGIQKLGGFQTRVCAVQGGQKIWIFEKNGFFGMMIKKGRNLTSGVRFSESARSIFSLRVQNEGVIQKGWTFDEKC